MRSRCILCSSGTSVLMYGCVQFTASAVLFLFMLCKTDDKAESESYWAGLIAAAIQQAELAARVCAQCLFTAGGKDPAGIGCHSPHSALQKGKGSVTFNLPPFSQFLCPCPTCQALLGCRGENGVPGLMLQATGVWRTRGKEGGAAMTRASPLPGQKSRLSTRWHISSSAGKKRVGWMYLNPLLREMGTLRATNGHGCSCAGTVLWNSLRTRYKTQACVETPLLSEPSLLIFGDSLSVEEKHVRL